MFEVVLMKCGRLQGFLEMSPNPADALGAVKKTRNPNVVVLQHNGGRKTPISMKELKNLAAPYLAKMRKNKGTVSGRFNKKARR